MSSSQRIISILSISGNSTSREFAVRTARCEQKTEHPEKRTGNPVGGKYTVQNDKALLCQQAP